MVRAGNSLGTVCGWQSYMADSRFPTMDGSTSTTSISFMAQGLTGTIPTQVGLLTAITDHLCVPPAHFSPGSPGKRALPP